MGHVCAHMGQGIPPSPIPYSFLLESVARTSPVEVRSIMDVDGATSWFQVGGGADLLSEAFSSARLSSLTHGKLAVKLTSIRSARGSANEPQGRPARASAMSRCSPTSL